MRLLAPLLASAALALLIACGCSRSSSGSTAVRSLPSPDLYIEYVPANDGTFQALVRVTSAGSSTCIQLPKDATSEVGGVSLQLGENSGSARDCACSRPTFTGKGPTPAATDGTFTTRDATAELSATVPDLFVTPTVAIESETGGPLSSMSRASRIYLVLSPANFTEVTDVAVTFTATGASAPEFTLGSSGGGVSKDGTRWYFEVPMSAASGAGVLGVKTLAKLQTTSCASTPASDPVTCNVVSLALRELTTSIQ